MDGVGADTAHHANKEGHELGQLRSSKRNSIPNTKATRPILVVEDDPRIRELLCWALHNEGLPVESVADGQAALDYLSHHRPAALLLDMGLPYVDGMRVGAEVRAIYGAALPIVVMTADDRVEEKAHKLMAFAYFQKPFDLMSLLGAVHAAVHSV
jgi:DNA-binding response OmpR family regulator